ncbi:AI-2E family transporter [Gudongella sp. SC589]|jgi:predicted PurR-regulated permease PerM|uniref:AI-2E family transporter n=1 Tax=Gudongella sp. SC589 TaxID=3385990 RepID=UPI003904A1EA
MKIEWNVRYLTIAAYSLVVICLSIVFYLIASDIAVFSEKVSTFLGSLQPIIIGAVMAYLFNFILEIIEKVITNPLMKKVNMPRLKRAIGIIFTYAIVGTIGYLFAIIVIPQLIASVARLVTLVTDNFDSISMWVIEQIEGLHIREDYLQYIVDWWNGVLDNTLGFVTGLIPVIGSIVGLVLASIWNIAIGIIVSVYLLFDKDRFRALGRKVTYSIFHGPRANRTLELARRADTIFGRFLSGKILDSFIIGILTYIILMIFQMPFPILVSFIIGVTNIIPFFGPFIGAVPGVFIIAIVSPIQALWFIVIVILLQQFDGNILGPKILGDSLGISAFWILFSLLVAGKLLGFIGLIIGVPLFVFVYSIIKDNVERRLAKKGLPIETREYF